MIHFSRLLLVLALCSTASLIRAEWNNDFEQIPENMKKAAATVLEWGFEQTSQRPQIAGLCLAAVLRKALTQKQGSFLIWAVAGVTVGAQASKIFADSYLLARKDKKIESPFVAKIEEVKEAAHALAVEAGEKVNKIVEEIKK